MKLSIDCIGLGQSLSVVGWAFRPDAVLTGLTLSVGGGTETAADIGLSRPDVAAAFPSAPQAAEAGFQVHGLPIPEQGGDVVLTAYANSARPVRRSLGHVQRGADGMLSFRPARAAGAASIVSMRPRPQLDFSFMEAILRAFAPEAPAPLETTAPALVIAPVYGALPLLPAFFDTLFAGLPQSARLVIVDDGNADPELLALLARQPSRHPGATLVRLPENRGYVEALWAAFEFWRGEHVVVVNTDTVLPPRWLERLLAPLSDPGVASTTPFSNAASICGFPDMPQDNPLWMGLDAGAIDGGLARIRPQAVRLDIPTGVGFCMAMASHALRRIGFIERQTFGRGYGEENDWCQRAVAAGFDNLLVPNLFVWHQHGGSFPSEDKRRLIERNLAIVAQRYPGYLPAVGELVLADPLRPLRLFAAFVLAAEAHPQGALMCAAVPGQADGRPCIVIDRPSGQLAWTYTFLFNGRRFAVRGGNLAEIAELRRRMPMSIDANSLRTLGLDGGAPL